MKARILLLIALTTSVSFVHAQLSLMMMSQTKMPSHSQVIKLQSPTILVKKNQLVNNDERGPSSPIIINYQNNLVPVAANDVNLFIADQEIPVPSLGGNQIYDYGNLTYEPENIFTNILIQPGDSNPSGARTIWMIPNNYLDINGLLVDTLSFPYTINSQGVYKTVVYFTAARVSLESITGVGTDSLIIPKQTVTEPSPSLQQIYPATDHSHWLTNPGVSGPGLFISLASEGLDHAPVTILHNHKLLNKIVGWGEIRVPTANGPSNYFRCLVNKITGADVLSVYVNGIPASRKVSQIFFGNSNYQQVYNYYQYAFLKKGFWDLGAEALFDMDPTFSVVMDAIFDETYLDIDCPGGVKMCVNGETHCVPYSHNAANHALLHGDTLGSCDGLKTENEEVMMSKESTIKIYPNPSSGVFNLKFQSDDEVAANATIEIRNEMGQIVFQKNYLITSGMLQQSIDLGLLRAGLYNLTVHTGAQVMMQPILIQ